MAKGKHAAALFEVIHSAKDRQDKSGALSTPKWWFKNRPKSETPAPQPIVQKESDVQPTPKATPEMPTRAASFASRVSASMDTSARQFMLRLTPRGAAIAGAALLVIVCCAYVIGKQFTGGPARATAAAVEDLRAGKPNAEVLNVASGTTNTSGAKAPLAAEVEAPTNGADAPHPFNSRHKRRRRSTPRFRSAESSTCSTWSFNRIQRKLTPSPPARFSRKTACRVPFKEGFGRKPDWFSVVGTTGFQRTRDNPQYEVYLKTVNTISEKFSAKSKFRQFEPMLFTWKGPSR